MSSNHDTQLSQLQRSLIAPAGELDDKYSRGCLGFVTGTERYPGAALLGIRTALNMGLGMVRYLGPKTVSDLVLLDRPEVVLGADRAQGWVIGSGVGDDDVSQTSNMLSAIGTGRPLVIDAGALQQVNFTALAHPSNCVITPHHREAAKLLTKFGFPTKKSEVDGHPLEVAVQLAKLSGVAVLLKSSRSVFVHCDALGQIRETKLSLGDKNLAVAGSGDVLAAILGSLIARYEAIADRSAAQAVELDGSESVMEQIVRLAHIVHNRAASLMGKSGQLGASRLAELVGAVVLELRSTPEGAA